MMQQLMASQLQWRMGKQGKKEGKYVSLCMCYIQI